MSSDLTLANKALKEKNYDHALKLYQSALAKQPELARFFKTNIRLAEKRLGHGHLQPSDTIDIVVTVYNALEDVKLCLESLVRHRDGFKVRVLLVNDGSEAVTSHWLKEFCSVNQFFQLIEHPFNKGYTCAVNTGLQASSADYVITLNSDTIVSAGWLQSMVRCMKSEPKIGVVGPLSNAATWQNVPTLRDETGGFAVNDLPTGQTVDAMAQLVASVSTRLYPRIPFVNGFCFMIKRAVIDKVGYMDADNFPVGYGEENDYCMRVADAGYELAIADDAYVFHAKSKSFGHDKRKLLSQQGTESIKRKHSPERYAERLAIIKKTETLDAARERISAALSHVRSTNQVDLMTMRILFLLPVEGGGGGAHSVVQEVTEMRRLGIHARVGVKQEDLVKFAHAYADIAGCSDAFVGFDDSSLLALAEGFDIVVGTIFTSMRFVKRIAEVHLHILPAYYVQDYEPMFFPEGSPRWQEARASYTLSHGAFLFAKTQWIIDVVNREHGITVHKVLPSIDHEVYRPNVKPDDGRLRIAAMIRPQTVYRGAQRTMRVLARLSGEMGDRLNIQIFGCADEHPEFQKLERHFSFKNHGVLLRPQVAKLLAESDLFIDLSDYQAFGRTALEAMACGCASVVPATGGTSEYAVNEQTAIVVDTRDEIACFNAINTLIRDQGRLRRLQRSALACAARYSVHSAAVSECLALETALQRHRKDHSPQRRTTLYVFPNQNAKGEPLGSAYVRLIYPYQCATVSQVVSVKTLKAMPDPDPGAIFLVHRHLPALTLNELRQWIKNLQGVGGRLIYDLDDDMLDTEALKHRGVSGDLKDVAERVMTLTAAADLVVASTPPLADKLKTINPNVVIIPNAIDRILWNLDSPRIHNMGDFKRDNNQVRIGYIGTPTHDADLALITPAMKALEAKYGKKILIEVIGGFESKKPTFGTRVALPKKSDYPNFVRWLQIRVHWDIAIIPLDIDEFNRSKSYLKFLECGALDMAMVVSDGPTYQAIARHEDNCLVAKNANDWVHQLSRLIENESLRERLATNAREEIKRHHTTENVAPLIIESIQQLSASVR